VLISGFGGRFGLRLGRACAAKQLAGLLLAQAHGGGDGGEVEPAALQFQGLAGLPLEQRQQAWFHAHSVLSGNGDEPGMILSQPQSDFQR
jgi:hypothetical protein